MNTTKVTEWAAVGGITLKLERSTDDTIRVVVQSDMEDSNIMQVYLTWSQMIAQQHMCCNPPALSKLLRDFSEELDRTEHNFRKAEGLA